MNDQLEYIDDYFQKQLTDEQRTAFEERCISDPEFAKEVAFYVSSREALREVLLEEKKKTWAELTPKEDINEAPQGFTAPLKLLRGGVEEDAAVTTGGAVVREIPVRKWLSLAVAACLVGAIVLYPFLSRNSGQDLAQTYVNEQLTRIANTMDAAQDSTKLGIEAYNNKRYQEAIGIFQGLSDSYPENTDALKYLGQSYLLAGTYDKALEKFRLLAAKPGLYSNPGLFLQGITLVQRHDDGDLSEAKKLFQQVVAQKLEGQKKAAELLKKLD